MVLMDYAINDVSAYLITKYLYMSLGESASGPTDTDLDALDTEVTALRTSTTNTITNTYSTNPSYPDTAQFTTIFTNSTGSSQSIYEAGLQTATYGSASDHLGARQTFTEWPIANGETVGIIWKVIPSRS